MKARTIALTIALCFIAVSAFAGSDALMGTWKLNEAKSKLPPGATKIHTVIYEAIGDQVRVTVKSTTAKGKSVQSEWTGKFDGKLYPVIGDPNADQVSFKEVSDRTLDIPSKKSNRVGSSTARIVVAPDGKSRTVTADWMDSSGMLMKIVAVYDKQ